MQAKDLYTSVKDDFTAVDVAIVEHLRSQVPLVEKIGQYIIESGGTVSYTHLRAHET